MYNKQKLACDKGKLNIALRDKDNRKFKFQMRKGKSGHVNPMYPEYLRLRKTTSETASLRNSCSIYNCSDYMLITRGVPKENNTNIEGCPGNPCCYFCLSRCCGA